MVNGFDGARIRRWKSFKLDWSVLNFSRTLFNIINRPAVFVKKFDGKKYILEYYTFFFTVPSFVSQDLISAVSWWMTVACYSRSIFKVGGEGGEIHIHIGYTKCYVYKTLEHRCFGLVWTCSIKTIILIDEHMFWIIISQWCSGGTSKTKLKHLLLNISPSTSLIKHGITL